ncbi:MAG TPA: MaoC/PaaZ C-terminal domain-containing protein [Solirubrobacteraceae bacterium]|jgi:acyl dehydratase|nr:MaoC/PaaZ C-terminal domain-containing protein [Solirubrobacteraceae bacterium]
MSDRRLTATLSMLPLFARAGLGMLPGASRLPFVGGGGGEIPDQALVRSEVAVDRPRLAAYDRVCGFDVSDTLPPTYPHMLAFPMHLALMTDGRFPLPAIGLVHIANTITVHRPIAAWELLSLRVWATPIEPHPRGRQFTIRTEARVGEELVWEEASTNLKRTDPPRGGNETAATADPPSAEGLPATATWKLKGDLGRRYGSVSGDLNPIHVHPLTARLFGFPTAIAHGMWTKARCLAALGPQLSGRGGRGPYTVSVAFKRPILLPATVQFAEEAGPNGIDFGVRDARRETPHLDGQVSFAAAARRPRRRA